MATADTIRVLAGIAERDDDHARLTGAAYRGSALDGQHARRRARKERCARSVWVHGIGFVDPKPA